MAEIEVRGLSKTFDRVTAPTCCRRMRTDGRTDTSVTGRSAPNAHCCLDKAGCLVAWSTFSWLSSRLRATRLGGTDPDWTHDLPLRLCRHGLASIDAELDVPLFRGGSAHARFWSLTRQQVRDRVIAEAVQARLDMRYPDSRRGYGPGGGVKIAWVPTHRQMTWACPAIRSWP